MAERLTVSLEDGSVERLRTLAGGERKVGAYLSRVVAWLYEQRDELEATPLEELTIGVAVEDEYIDELLASIQVRLARIEANIAETTVLAQQPA